METITLLDLGPIIAAVLGPMLAFVVVSMRYQHNDSAKTHALIERYRRENRELIERSSGESRELIERSSGESRELIERSSTENRELIERVADKLSTELAEHRRLSEQRHQEVVRSLGDARERLARIEGHLRIGTPPPRENEAGTESGRAA